MGENLPPIYCVSMQTPWPQMVLCGKKKIEIRGSNIWGKRLGTWLGLHVSQDVWKGAIPEAWVEFVEENRPRMYRKRGRVIGK